MDGNVFDMIKKSLKGKQFPDKILITKINYNKLWISMIWEGRRSPLEISVDYTNGGDLIRTIGNVGGAPIKTPGKHILWDEEVNESLLERYSNKVVDWNNRARTKYDQKNEFNMFAEEYLEYDIADGAKDRIEKADAIIDMMFVFIGTLHKLKALDLVIDKCDINKITGFICEHIGCINSLKRLGENQPVDIEECADMLNALLSQLVNICNGNYLLAEELMNEVYESNMSKIDDHLGDSSNSPKVGKGNNYIAPDLKSIFNKYDLT